MGSMYKGVVDKEGCSMCSIVELEEPEDWT